MSNKIKKIIKRATLILLIVSMVLPLLLQFAYAKEPNDYQTSYFISGELANEYNKFISDFSYEEMGDYILTYIRDYTCDYDYQELKNEEHNESFTKQNMEGFRYIKEIPMPEKHQKYLYAICKKRGLNYLKTLALLKHESQFKSDIISSTNDYGYMQINAVNHNRLSKQLKTPNTPLDPYVNINWGTYMLKELYDMWSKKGIDNTNPETSITILDRYVISSYNKGVAGFRKYGEATKYIEKVESELELLLKLIN